jgi:cellulose synthase/poly-beta-1,6-N-acetylglucosamine synthase-like glycosyltransferase
MIAQNFFFVISLILTFLFFLYGFNEYYLLIASRRYKPPKIREVQELPPVSIQIPIYNEKYVVKRVIAACARMAETYGVDKVNILILDDSDDDTRAEIDSIVADCRAHQCQMEVLRRPTREGFKAGALRAALARTPEEFIAIFDADFIPPPDFLSLIVPHLLQDERLAIVQSRWGHLNREYSSLTRGAAILMDIHFMIEQSGRYADELFQNFNGSGGILRKSAILQAGGWQADTLAEDLDLSYRMQMLGYRVLYLKDIICPGEIPPTLPTLKMQQSRWACGSLRTARKILPSLLRDKSISFKKRLQSVIHLTGYLIHPLMAIAFISACLSTFFSLNTLTARQAPALTIQNTIWLVLLPLIVLCTLAPWVAAIITLREQKWPLWKNLQALGLLFLIGFGSSLNNSLGAAKALFTNRNYEWTRTPKYADLQDRSGWRERKYKIKSEYVWLLELTFAGLGLLSIGFSLLQSNFAVLLILVPFTIAYMFISIQTVLQT